MKYPLKFLNKNGNVCATISKEISVDGTPRYICNPKCPENTYTLQDCLKDWKPVYFPIVGEIYKWKEYFVKVHTVKKRDELVRVSGTNDGRKSISWLHWLDFEDLKLENGKETTPEKV